MLALAHTYEVLALCDTCSSRLIGYLCVENAAEILQSAHLYGLTTLKDAAINYMFRDPVTTKAVQDTEAFDALAHDLTR